MESQAQEDEVLKQLRELLLADELQQREELRQELETIKAQLDPLVAQKVESLTNKLLELSEPVISQKVHSELMQAQDTIAHAIQPMLGRMVSSYIKRELERLSDNIDQRLERAFSLKNIFKQFSALWEGVSYRDVLLQESNKARVEEVYVINQASGLLVGKYSTGDTIDQDLIAGMLTAIKAFIEDAFKQKGGSLDMIEYGSLKIILHNYYRFYIAVVVSGVVNSATKNGLIEYMNVFAEKFLSQPPEMISEEDIGQKLAQYFGKLHAANQ
ncbi:hypothetical protein [Eisenibacter elegans]|jgi:hypothetical protein|uniref:hypothetical protein n=1 Tax=Eisenibacter elegans TaxID=997 RepID=UPI00040BFA59|nr:hypothetical protein [Eisenibacter elegans]